VSPRRASPPARDPTEPAHLCRIEHDDRGTARLALHGELNLAAAKRLDATVHDLVLETPELVLDLSRVTFIDCCGLSAILRCHQACRDGSCSLTLLHPSEQVRELLARVGLLDRLAVIEAPPAAGEHPQGNSRGDAA
jgi:anti-sigma B factor antagonist